MMTQHGDPLTAVSDIPSALRDRLASLPSRGLSSFLIKALTGQALGPG